MYALRSLARSTATWGEEIAELEQRMLTLATTANPGPARDQGRVPWSAPGC
ncbi:MAG: hypothetical protein IPF42_11280 [Candidatus Microthrix sp.]|nr:hypothetical protein [Candidatus Microthrix sp.]